MPSKLIHIRHIEKKNPPRLNVVIDRARGIVDIREERSRLKITTTLSALFGRAWYEGCVAEAHRVREERIKRRGRYA